MENRLVYRAVGSVQIPRAHNSSICAYYVARVCFLLPKGLQNSKGPFRETALAVAWGEKMEMKLEINPNLYLGEATEAHKTSIPQEKIDLAIRKHLYDIHFGSFGVPGNSPDTWMPFTPSTADALGLRFPQGPDLLKDLNWKAFEG